MKRTTETTETEQASKPKRKGGWPAGRPRKSRPGTEQPAAPAGMLAKMKARPNWEDDNFVGAGAEYVDRLHIDPELVQALWRDGVALQWITKSVRGAEISEETTKFIRGGWTPVHQSDFDGLLDGKFMQRGVDEVITVDDCMLVARPRDLHSKARNMALKSAGEPMQRTEDLLKYGVPNVTGAEHPTVRNSINKRMERVEIPGE